MSLKSFEKEINILKKNLNRDSLIISRENVMDLIGTESGYEIIQAFKSDLKRNMEVIKSILILRKNPEELNDLDIDLNEIPIIKKGLLRGVNESNLQDVLLNEYFSNNEELISIYNNVEGRKLKKIYNSVLTEDEDKIEYIKYSRERNQANKLSEEIIQKNLEYNDRLTPMEFDDYRTEFTGNIATVYSEKKDSVLIDKIDGKAVLIQENPKLKIDQELLDLITNNKYINKMEVDAQTDLKKLKQFLLEIADNEFSVDTSIYLKIRFLGKHRASGLYYPTLKVLAVSVTEEYSFAHEMAHHMDFSGGIKNKNEILTTIQSFNDYKNIKNLEYFSNPHEIIARAGEFSYALMQGDFSDIYKAYKNGTKYKGELVNNENFHNLVLSSSKSTRLANDLEYYVQNKSVYFDFNERTPEELAYFYSSFQNLYRFKETIEVTKSEKQNALEIIESQKTKKKGYKRKAKKGFATYSSEDFDYVIEEFKQDNVDIMTKKDFYIQALLSTDNNYKYYTYQKLFQEEDFEDIFVMLKEEILEEAKNISAEILEDSGIKISEDDIFQFIIFGRNKILADVTKNVSFNKNILDYITVKDSELRVLLQIVKAMKIKNKDDLLEKMLSNKSFKYQNELENYIAIYKEELTEEEKIEYSAAAYSLELGRRPVQSYLTKELKKLSDNTTEIINRVILNLDNIDNTYRKKQFIIDNIDNIDVVDYSKYNIVSPDNIEEYMEKVNIEEMYKQMKEGQIILVPLNNNVMSKYSTTERSEKFAIYRSMVEKLNSFKAAKIKHSDDAVFNPINNTLETNISIIDIEKITSDKDEIIKVGNVYYKTDIADNEREYSFMRSKSENFIKREKITESVIITDQDKMRTYFSSYSIKEMPAYIYIDVKSKRAYGFNNLDKLNHTIEQGQLKLENQFGDKIEDIIYHTDVSMLNFNKENQLEVSYNKPELELSLISYLGSDYEKSIVANTTSEEELLAIVFNMINSAENNLSMLFEKSRFINEVEEKYGILISTKLTIMYVSELIKNNRFVDYIELNTIIPNKILLNDNPEVILAYMNGIISNIYELQDIMKPNILKDLEDNLSASNVDNDTIIKLKNNLEEDIKKVSNKVMWKLYKVLIDKIEIKIEKQIEDIWFNKLGMTTDKYSLNDILKKFKESGEKDDTLNYMYENITSVKKMTSKEFIKFYQQNFNTNLNIPALNIGNKNIFDYSEGIANSTRKSIVILKPEDKKKAYMTLTLKEAEKLSSLLQDMNSSLGHQSWKEGMYINSSSMGFIKLLNSITDLISTPNKFLSEKKVKKTTKKSVKKTKEEKKS